MNTTPYANGIQTSYSMIKKIKWLRKCYLTPKHIPLIQHAFSFLHQKEMLFGEEPQKSAFLCLRRRLLWLTKWLEAKSAFLEGANPSFIFNQRRALTSV
jgi:hypothetical protein